MFSRDDLDRLSATLRDRDFGRYRGMHHHLYPQHAFSPPDGEEAIRITRAPKEAGDDGFRFWVCAEMADERLPPSPIERDAYIRTRFEYFQSGLYRSIAETEFNRAVAESCSGLIAPPRLPLRQTGFVGALAIYTMEVEFIVSLFAEYEDEFLHFYWETLA